MGYSLLGAGREAQLTRSSVLAIVSSLAVGIVLMVRFGIIGACWFLLLRQAFAIVFMIPDFARTFLSRTPQAETPAVEILPGDAVAEMSPSWPEAAIPMIDVKDESVKAGEQAVTATTTTAEPQLVATEIDARC